MDDSFRLLGLAPRVYDKEEILRAYRRASLGAHPDKGGSLAAMEALKEARDDLLAHLGQGPPRHELDDFFGYSLSDDPPADPTTMEDPSPAPIARHYLLDATLEEIATGAEVEVEDMLVVLGPELLYGGREVEPGLIIEVRPIPSPDFTLDHYDLVTSLTLSLKEALLGFRRYVVHPSGRVITCQSDEMTRGQGQYKVAGEGLGPQGSLIVRLSIAWPTTITSFSGRQRRLLAQAL